MIPPSRFQIGRLFTYQCAQAKTMHAKTQYAETDLVERNLRIQKNLWILLNGVYKIPT